MYTDQFKHLQCGEEVAIKYERFGGVYYKVTEIIEVTSGGNVICSNGMVFNSYGHFMFRDRYADYGQLVLITKDIELECRVAFMIQAIKEADNIRLATLNLKDIERCYKIMYPIKRKKSRK